MLITRRQSTITHTRVACVEIVSSKSQCNWQLSGFSSSCLLMLQFRSSGNKETVNGVPRGQMFDRSGQTH